MLKFIQIIIKIEEFISKVTLFICLDGFGVIIGFVFMIFDLYWPLNLFLFSILYPIFSMSIIYPFLLKIETKIENRKFSKELKLNELKIKEEENKKNDEWNKLSIEEKERILKERKKVEVNEIRKKKIAETKRINREKKLLAEDRERKILIERTLKRIESIQPFFKDELSISTRYKIEQMDDKEFNVFLKKEEDCFLKKQEKQKEEIEKQKIIELKKIEDERLLKIKKAEIEKEKQIKEAIRRELLEKERLKKLRSDVINELISEGKLIEDFSSTNKRESIPSDIKLYVWERDKGRCVNCGNNQNLEFDHIIPFSKGGANTLKNLQLLCLQCNRQKSNKIV